MALPESGILIDRKTMMNSDPDLALEVQFITSSSPVMQHRSGVALAIINDSSVGDDATEAEFVGFSDEKLQDNINRWCFNGMNGLLSVMPDGGEKMWIRLHRMKKELEHREIVKRKKVRKNCIFAQLFQVPRFFLCLTQVWLMRGLQTFGLGFSA
jgi:hypothetical protein